MGEKLARRKRAASDDVSDQLLLLVGALAPHDGGFRDRFMPLQHRLDFGRKDFRTAAKDHLGASPLEMDVAELVDRGDLAGIMPAVAEIPGACWLADPGQGRGEANAPPPHPPPNTPPPPPFSSFPPPPPPP